MSWVAVGVAAAGATLAYMENDRQNKMAAKREKASRMENAAQTEVSWARKDGKGTINPVQLAPIGKSNIGAAMQGGLSGFMMGNSINSGMSKGSTTGTTQPTGSDPQANSLGGQDMSAKLGQQSQAFQTSMAGSPAMQPSSNPLAGGTTMNWEAMGQQQGIQPNYFGGEQPNFMSYNGAQKKPSLMGR